MAVIVMMWVAFVGQAKHAQDAAIGCGEVIEVHEVGRLHHHYERRTA